MTNCNQCDACEKLKRQLIKAIEIYDTEAVKTALEQGADVNAKDEAGYTPLHWAARNGHTEMVKLLIEKGADVNAKNNDGNTLLHIAARWGKTEVAKVLLENGANVNAMNKLGNPPLYEAISSGCTEVAKVLLEKGADVNEKDGDGDTHMKHAVYRGHTKIVKLIQQYRKNNPSDYFMDIDKLMSDLGSVIRNYERKFRSGYLNNSDLENLHKSEKLLKEASQLLINNFSGR